MSIRTALIGFGLAGADFHAPLLAGSGEFSLETVVTSDPERTARARREHPGVALAAETEELWERAGAHDLVVVATRNDSHVPLADRALGLGLHVVVDKPLATSSEAAAQLAGRAEAAGVVLTPFHNRRWDSDQLTLRRLVGEGALGEVRRYESRFERWRPELRPGTWREETAPAAGGGVLLDLGYHLVDQALALFGPAQSVYGEVDHRRGGPADDDVFIALEHESGVRSHLWASSVAGALGPRLRVLGSAGAYVVDGLDGQEDALREGRRPEPGGPWGEEPPERWGRLHRGEESEPVPSERGAWPAFYERLAAAIRDGTPPPVDPRDAVEVLRILELSRGRGP